MASSSSDKSSNYPPILDILKISRVIPVVSIANIDHAVPLANALLRGGIRVIEVTLRTPVAIECIEQIAKEVPQMCVGAGTVWTREDAKNVRKAGAQFIVSPGRSDAVYKYCKKHKIPLLPGTQTASEIAVWVERGLNAVKFFPAETSGGVKALKAFGAVFDGLKICPTGGISSDSAQNYLDLPNVDCVGGSWIVSKQALAEENWQAITEVALQANPGSVDGDGDAPPWDQ